MDLAVRAARDAVNFEVVRVCEEHCSGNRAASSSRKTTADMPVPSTPTSHTLGNVRSCRGQCADAVRVGGQLSDPGERGRIGYENEAHRPPVGRTLDE